MKQLIVTATLLASLFGGAAIARTADAPTLPMGDPTLEVVALTATAEAHAHATTARRATSKAILADFYWQGWFECEVGKAATVSAIRVALNVCELQREELRQAIDRMTATVTTAPGATFVPTSTPTP